MANVEINDLTSKGTPLSTDELELQGTGGGSSAKAALGDLLDVAAGKQTMWMPAAWMTAAATSGAAAAVVDSGDQDVNIAVLDFDTAADEYAHFSVAFPKSWDEGTVTFQVFWMSAATDTDGVAWGLQAVAFANSDPLNTAFGTAIVVEDDNISAAQDVLVTDESAAVTIAGNPGVDELVNFRVLRDVSNGNDVMSEDARLLGIKLFWTTDARNDD